MNCNSCQVEIRIRRIYRRIGQEEILTKMNIFWNIYTFCGVGGRRKKVRCANMFNTAEAEVLETTAQEDEEFHSGKIYCANCIHCKLIPAKPGGPFDSQGQGSEDRYVLRIRCAAGKWKKKLGEEKLYKYCTITRRYQDTCDAYEAMGDTREFIRELRKTLSSRDDLYGGFRAEESAI
jgi:hypothetical protein